MPFCINCGVELDNRHTQCPLCNLPLEFPEKREFQKPLYPSEVNKISIIKTQTSERANNFLIFSRFLTFLSITTTVGLNYYMDKELNWSLISSLSIIFLYFVLTSSIHLFRNPKILYTYLNINLSVYLFILDHLTEGNNWFIPYALPCFISLQLISLITRILFNFISDKLLKAVVIILVTNIFLVIINRITSGHISWSLVTSAIFLPTAIYLVYLNKILNTKRYYL